MERNYPNPFNPSTTIRYQLHRAGDIKLEIYSTTGQVVRRLVNQRQNAGSYVVQWDGRDDFGRRVASGSYFYRLRAGEAAESKKMLVLK